jgi:hypothetical protein
MIELHLPGEHSTPISNWLIMDSSTAGTRLSHFTVCPSASSRAMSLWKLNATLFLQYDSIGAQAQQSERPYLSLKTAECMFCGGSVGLKWSLRRFRSPLGCQQGCHCVKIPAKRYHVVQDETRCAEFPSHLRPQLHGFLST